jgi:hypothetical protein
MPMDSHLPQADPFSLVPTFKYIKNPTKSSSKKISKKLVSNVQELRADSRANRSVPVHLSFVFNSFFAAEIRRKKCKLLTDLFRLRMLCSVH